MVAQAPITIHLDDDLRETLEREAELEGRRPAELAVRAIRSLVQAKATKRAAIESALEAAEQGRFVSSEAMNAWIDSWDTKEELTPPKPEPFPRK